MKRTEHGAWSGPLLHPCRSNQGWSWEGLGQNSDLLWANDSSWESVGCRDRGKEESEASLGFPACVLGNRDLPLENDRVPQTEAGLAGGIQITWQIIRANIFYLSSIIYFSVY